MTLRPGSVARARPMVVTLRLVAIAGILLASGLWLVGPMAMLATRLYQHASWPWVAEVNPATARLTKDVQREWNTARRGRLDVQPAEPARPSDQALVRATTQNGITFWVEDVQVAPLPGTAPALERRVVVNLPLGRALLAARLQDLLDAGPDGPEGSARAIAPAPLDDLGMTEVHRVPLRTTDPANQRLFREGDTLLLLTRDRKDRDWHWQVSGPYQRLEAVLDALDDDQRMLVKAFAEAQATVAGARRAASAPSAFIVPPSSPPSASTGPGKTGPVANPAKVRP